MFPEATIISILIAFSVSYLIGALPLAAVVSRLRGVDIFASGTGLPGAANVLRNVGYMEGGIVFWGDVLKGGLSITVAYRIGVSDGFILIPAFATVLGHWRSIFTKFRGGDGLSPLVGMTIVILPIYGLIATFTGFTVAAIASKAGRHASIWGGIAAYGFILVRAPFMGFSSILPLGVVVLALLVFAHGFRGHRKRRAEAKVDR
ncbi:MAG: glycerol-3-phosphate acyltransferase PlsY [Chloroflexi bacterium]|jgi:glycerol-3-phosphate acyltransferase PlsY|nr:MAG: glycerol-3-phosphate acyltransferase PlsY [Chloroflexota bacterium]